MAAHRLTRLPRLSSRQVDALLAAGVVIAIITGVASWAIGTKWVKVLTVAHAIAGFSLVVLAPLKVRGSMATGLKRRRPTRYASMLLGVLVIATVVLGVAHTTGLWFGHGRWSPLWTHQLLAFVVLLLLVWHMGSRPAAPRRADLDRRALVGGGAAVAVAGVVYGAQETIVRITPLAGGDRRFTGSHQVASFDPENMPVVQWLNDKRPRTPTSEWELRVGGELVDLGSLDDRVRPVIADLDCTGGWWSRQSWDAVPLSDLLPDLRSRSIRVRSATGYSRLYPAGDAGHLHLAIGYSEQPLDRRHGGPVRIVAPGRRGPWWIKWVTSIEPDDRPWWLQSPFPLS